MNDNMQKGTHNKKWHILYWICTVLFVIPMAMGAYFDFVGGEQVVEGMKHLGYPLYLATFIGVAKGLGVLAVLVNKCRTLKEWAYAGFTFDLLGASYSHFSVGDPIKDVMVPLVILIFVLTSYKLWKCCHCPGHCTKTVA